MYKIQTWKGETPITGYLASYYNRKEGSLEFVDNMSRQQTLKIVKEGDETITIDGVEL
jgi:hypothetical protein